MDDFSSQKSYNFLGNIPDIIHQSTNQTAAHCSVHWHHAIPPNVAYRFSR